MTSFNKKLSNAIRKNNSLLCVGLDPLLEKLPPLLRGSSQPILDFNRAIIDATADLVCAFKPQIAYYAAQSSERELLESLDYLRERHPEIPIILDAKRGDIGETSSQYAREIFDRYGADAATVNPYMGTDSLEPFLRYKEKGVFVLCHTSNPGAADLQNGLYPKVAKLARERWNRHGNVGLVAGATAPEKIREIRTIAGEDIPLLVPGIGAQGGDLESCMKAGNNSAGTGIIVNSSRGIIYAGGGENFAETSRQAAIRLRDQINQYRQTL